jgi:hypothetical protein
LKNPVLANEGVSQRALWLFDPAMEGAKASGVISRHSLRNMPLVATWRKFRSRGINFILLKNKTIL